MTEYQEYPADWPRSACEAVDLAIDRAEDAEARIAELERERDNALAKAAVYERDWYAAKTEFGDARGKLQARILDLTARLEKCARAGCPTAAERPVQPSSNNQTKDNQ